MIFSIDGGGVVTIHLPTDGRESGSAAELETGGEVRLPFSYELDAAPRFERFFFVAADEPFSLAPVLSRARELARTGDAAKGTLELGDTFALTDLPLLKDGTR